MDSPLAQSTISSSSSPALHRNFCFFLIFFLGWRSPSTSSVVVDVSGQTEFFKKLLIVVPPDLRLWRNKNPYFVDKAQPDPAIANPGVFMGRFERLVVLELYRMAKPRLRILSRLVSIFFWLQRISLHSPVKSLRTHMSVCGSKMDKPIAVWLEFVEMAVIFMLLLLLLLSGWRFPWTGWWWWWWCWIRNEFCDDDEDNMVLLVVKAEKSERLPTTATNQQTTVFFGFLISLVSNTFSVCPLSFLSPPPTR